MIAIIAAQGPPWRKLFSLKERQVHPSGIRESGRDDVLLFEYGLESAPAVQAGFLAGLLYERSGGFTAQWRGCPVLFLQDKEDPISGRERSARGAESAGEAQSSRQAQAPGHGQSNKSPVLIHNRIFINGRCEYPDIVLDHGFPETTCELHEENRISFIMESLGGLLSPHQLVSAELHFRNSSPGEDWPRLFHQSLDGLISYCCELFQLESANREADIRSALLADRLLPDKKAGNRRNRLEKEIRRIHFARREITDNELIAALEAGLE